MNQLLLLHSTVQCTQQETDDNNEWNFASQSSVRLISRRHILLKDYILKWAQKKDELTSPTLKETSLGELVTHPVPTLAL